MQELTPTQRQALKGRAHSLNPVVSISQNGLSESVIKEIDRNLKAHELIKIRVYGVDRFAREALLQEVCTAVAAQPVQHIGNILVVYRPRPDGDKTPAQTSKNRAASPKSSVVSQTRRRLSAAKPAPTPRPAKFALARGTAVAGRPRPR